MTARQPPANIRRKLHQSSGAHLEDMRCVPLQEAAAMLSVHAQTILRLMQRGLLRGTKVANNIRVYVWSLDEYLKSNEIMPTTEKRQEEKRIGRRAGASHHAAMNSLEELGIVDDGMV